MSRKTKKENLGKRLWHSITEPIPDDNEEQDSEQIPLAYDLKDSAAPQSGVQESQADKAKSVAPQENQVFYPQSATTSAAAKAGNATKKVSSASHQVIDSAQATTSTVAASSVTSADASQVSTSAQATQSHKRTGNRIPADNVPTSNGQRERIVVQETEQRSADEQPELPLSREELYGDQQPNGGKEPDLPVMSRVERHGERVPDADEPQVKAVESKASEPDELQESENPHLKKTGHHYSWKLMLTGVAILVVAAGGALFMWNHAQTTQAAAKTNAEASVNKVYTSTAQRDLRASASTDQLKQLQTDIDEMKDSSDKDTLQKQHDYAVKMLAVRTSYQNLRNTKGLIKADVTMDTITKAQQRITTAGLTSDKTYFANKYDQKYATTGKVVKKVVSYDADFQKLYNKKNKLKSSTASTKVDKVLANLKRYRKQSQLAATDYSKLIADRKQLAKASSSSASSSSVESYSSSSSSEVYSSSSDSSSSDDYSSSSSDYSSTTSATTGYYGNDTATSSATSSSTTQYSSSETYSSSTDNGTSTDTTGNSTTSSDTTGYSTTTGNN